MVVVSQEWLTGVSLLTLRQHGRSMTAGELREAQRQQGSSTTARELNDSRVLDDSRGKLVDGGGKPRMVDVGVSLLMFAGLGHCWL